MTLKLKEKPMFTLILLFSLYTPNGGAHLEARSFVSFQTIELCQTEGKKAVADMGDKPSPSFDYINRMRVQFSCIKTGKTL